LRALRRTAAIFHPAGDENHSIARHRKLALAAPAPEFEDRFTAIADLQRRQPLRSRLTRHVQRHLQAERKAVIGAGWPDVESNSDEPQRNGGFSPHASE